MTTLAIAYGTDMADPLRALCLKSLEAARFDKVKPAREHILEALQFHRDLANQLPIDPGAAAEVDWLPGGNSPSKAPFLRKGSAAGAVSQPSELEAARAREARNRCVPVHPSLDAEYRLRAQGTLTHRICTYASLKKAGREPRRVSTKCYHMLSLL